MANQRGIALIGVLAALFAGAVIAMVGLERAYFNQRLSSLAADHYVAMEAAEAALRVGQSQYLDQARAPVSLNVGADAREWANWLATSGQPLPGLADRRSLARSPRLLVERLKPRYIDDCVASTACGYRLTVLAYGYSDRSRVVLRSVVSDASDIRLWRELT